MNKKGTLLVISGFAGTGKGSVVGVLTKDYGYALSISATTRSPRNGEVDGVHYHFKEKEEFIALIEKNGFIEHAQYVGNYYGTPRKFVEDEMEAGNTVILEIEVQGALKIKEQYPDAVLVFIAAPTVAMVKERLINRNTETMEVIEKRMKQAVTEAESIENYDYIVINDVIEDCAARIHNIVESETQKIGRNASFIQQIKDDLAVL